MSKIKSKYIRVEKPVILKNQLLLCKISHSRNLDRYFQKESLTVEYDCNIGKVNTSILQIPVLSNVVTIAWAAGADIYIGDADRSYLESLEKIKAVMKGWYPKLPFSTNIHVENTVSNKFVNQRYGLLFSGGIDSTSSYITHKNRKPNLITIWGADIFLSEGNYWREVKNKNRDFASQENVEINFLKTNLHEFINEGSLDAEYARFLYGSWWGAMHHGLGMLGICAPLTIAKHIGYVMIASSTVRYPGIYPWGSHWLTDSQLTWGDVKVIHDGYKVSRQRKIGSVLKTHIENTGQFPTLRVCYSQSSALNCCKCEKCSRTIAGLVLENIDPRECGFNLDGDYFQQLKRKLLKGGLLHEDNVGIWRDIQKNVPDTLNHNLYDSREFFSWFRNFDLEKANADKSKSKFSLKWCLFYTYYRLPRSVREVLAHLNPFTKYLISL